MASKRKGSGAVKTAQYYVWYLGWKECRGLGGREYTEPIVKDLVFRRKTGDLPKLTIEVSKKELKIFQLAKGKWGKTEKIKYPTVPSKDVTYAAQGLPPDEDVVACIYLGFNPTTRQAVHVHVYRCDSPETAFVMVEHLTELIKMPEHAERMRQIEMELAARGEIIPRPRNFINTYDGLSTASRTPSTVDTATIRQLSDSEDSDSDNPHSSEERHRPQQPIDDPEVRQKEAQMESLASELKLRLGIRNAPILLPPQDYDTIRLKHGDFLTAYDERKCLNKDIVGLGGSVDEPDDVFGPAESDSTGHHSGSRDTGAGSRDGGSRDGGSRDGRLESRSSDGHAVSPRTSDRGSRGREVPPDGYGSSAVNASHDMHRPNGVASSDADLHVVSPRWKTGNQVFVPPGGAGGVPGYGRPRSPSPGPRGPRPSNPHRARSPSPGPGGRRAMSPGAYQARRGRSPEPHSKQAAYRAVSPRGRSPHPAFTPPVVSAVVEDPRGRPVSPSGGGRRQRSRSRNRYMGEPAYSPLPAPGPENPYQAGPRKYSASAMGVSTDPGYYGGGPGGRPPHDEGYRSLERTDMYGAPPPPLAGYATDARKEKKKKDKRGKSKREAGDDLPVDYTVAARHNGERTKYSALNY